MILPLALLATALTGSDLTAALPSPAPTGATYASGFDMSSSWANLRPYKDASGFNVSKGVPMGCELSQAHLLHRHAQRYPTDSYLDGGGMETFSQKLKNYSAAHANTSVGEGPLAFLNMWEYMLGGDNLLVNGAATEATAGADAWSKYGRLLYRAKPGATNWNEALNVYPTGTARPRPVFRTTSRPRILESARWWLSGFFSNSGANNSYAQYGLVIIPEVRPFNITLTGYDACPGNTSEGYQGNNAAAEYIPKFTKDAQARLSRFFPADFNLTAYDVFAMQNLCPYETTALGSSAFCSLFTEQEWRDYAYAIDIKFYGNYGFGSSTGRAQGIGYVLELAARLEGKLIHSSDTSINYTYDNNEATFPLHQPLYMDMSHESTIISALATMNLTYFRYGPHGLPVIDHAPPRNFSTSEMTPYSARLVSEIWTCPVSTSLHHLGPVLYRNPDLSSVPNTTDYIRFVLNDAPVPLDGLIECAGSVNGFCALDDFLKAVPQMKNDAMYQFACFGEYDTGGRQVGNGRPE